ncbi:MAG: RtcB family protein [Pleurocapsa sp. MO_226.B13]|nr:RtcB family protein [Pleurocapsa sp. MO_226.B13]
MPHEQLDLSTKKSVLSWANHQLDKQEAQMAQNVASLPFVFKHVALMPDVHLGERKKVGEIVVK